MSPTHDSVISCIWHWIKMIEIWLTDIVSLVVFSVPWADEWLEWIIEQDHKWSINDVMVCRLSGSRWSQDMGKHAGMYEIDREIWALVFVTLDLLYIKYQFKKGGERPSVKHKWRYSEKCHNVFCPYSVSSHSCFGTHWLLLYEQKQLKHSSKYPLFVI